MRAPLLMALLLALCLRSAEGMHFLMQSGERRCFVQDVQDKTNVIGQIDTPDLADYNRKTVALSVRDPSGSPVLEKDVDDAGRFAFSAKAPGEYVICVFTREPSLPTPSADRFKLYVHFQKGQDENYFKQLASEKQISEIQAKIRYLKSRAEELLKEQGVIRNREEVFRNTSEETNSYIVWWNVLQIVVFIGVAYYQVKYLKALFLKKKLV